MRLRVTPDDDPLVVVRAMLVVVVVRCVVVGVWQWQVVVVTGVNIT